jgi:hypothetical protein
MVDSPLAWVPCRLVAGHGVASGRSASSPYPTGTILLQQPFFAAAGIDLSPWYPGTLNLDAAPLEWRLSDADARVEQLRWTDLHPPETFSFWHCRLRHPGLLPATADLAALIYHPHPQTKRAHHQSAGCVEVLAPWIEGLHPGQVLELGVDPRRCRLVDPRRLRARLLEFLKFRVLAAQAEFFHSLEDEAEEGVRFLSVERLRAWLAPLWSEALDLRDPDLLATFEQARRLYGP